MGVYIPNLKMPQTCEDCTLESYCGLWIEARRLCGETFTDAKSRVKATIRHPDCPLVELPQHGRLIDRDALTLFEQIATRDAPTIIEAEVEE